MNLKERIKELVRRSVPGGECSPEGWKSLRGAALLTAFASAVCYMLSRHYGIGDEGKFRYLLPGLWSLSELVMAPWLIMVGVIISYRLSPCRRVRLAAGLLAGAFICVSAMCSALHPGWRYYLTGWWLTNFLNTVACVLAGVSFFNGDPTPRRGRENLICIGFLFLSFVVYLGCMFLLWGWRARFLELPDGICSVLSVLSHLAVAAVSMALVGVCRSRAAAILVRPAAVKMVLILLCVYPFARYSYGLAMRPYMLSIYLNPLVIGTLMYAPRFFRRLSSELVRL